MEYLTISKQGGPSSGFHIEGFPDAVKVGRLTGPKARRLSHLALHLGDFRSAATCLATLDPKHAEPIRSALWFTALVEFMKCFGSSRGRFSLSAKEVYRGNQSALDAFEFFKDMRHKHYVHCENAFAQALPGAIINGTDCSHKIAKVVTFEARADIISDENFINLHLLIQDAIKWVMREYDELCNTITSELEKLPYQELLSLPNLEYKKPVALDVARGRTQP
jgi:hypothetical protein